MDLSFLLLSRCPFQSEKIALLLGNIERKPFFALYSSKVRLLFLIKTSVFKGVRWNGNCCPYLQNEIMPIRAVKATFHLTISMRGRRATGKIKRNNYHHGSCEPFLTGKTMSGFWIITHGTHRNVKIVECEAAFT